MKQHVSTGHASNNQLKQKYGDKFTSEQISRTIKACVTCATVVPKTNIRKSPTREYEVGEMISADLIGPMNVSYGLIISEKKSNFIIARVLKSKTDVSPNTLEILKSFKNPLSLTKNTIVTFRADNEFDTKVVAEYCELEGITTQFTAPHSSYQNGFAESQNYQVERNMKYMLIDAKHSHEFLEFCFSSISLY